MEINDKEAVEVLARQYLGEDSSPKVFRFVSAAMDFFAVDYNDILVLGDGYYLIRGVETEKRFGIEDDPKYWVKRVVDLKANYARKIIKFCFFEEFDSHIGGIKFKLARSPAKEARILKKVEGHPNFMQGRTVEQIRGNPIRVLDFINGPSLYEHLMSLRMEYDEYFYQALPSLLDRLIVCFRAMGWLHDQDEVHGDIRQDHILIDKADGLFRWIDFDYNYSTKGSRFGYDMFGLGNILAAVVGGGSCTLQQLKAEQPEVLDRLYYEDTNIVWSNRVVNLKKVYPQIPEGLNRVLMHFSAGATVFYETVWELLEDLEEARVDL